MNLLDKRKKSQEHSILEGRFIRTVLKEEGDNILQEQTKRMNKGKFRTRNFFTDRKINVTDSIMKMDHLAKHRFVDMRRRMTKGGIQRKKSYPIHNRVLYGHANNIVHRIGFGFTEEVVEQMRNLKED